MKRGFSHQRKIGNSLSLRSRCKKCTLNIALSASLKVDMTFGFLEEMEKGLKKSRQLLSVLNPQPILYIPILREANNAQYVFHLNKLIFSQIHFFLGVVKCKAQFKKNLPNVRGFFLFYEYEMLSVIK